MNTKRFNYLMIAVTSLTSIAIFGSVVVANSLLKQQSKKLYDLKLQSQVLGQQQINLAKAKKDIAKYSELNREAKIIVPQDKDQAAAVREITNIAKSTGVAISGIQFPASTLGSSSQSSNTSTGSVGSSTTTSIKSKTPVTQVQPVPGLKGVYVMPITIQVSNAPVSYSGFVKFLSKLEQNRRTAQVSSVSIQPLATSPNKLNFTLIVNVYIKP